MALTTQPVFRCVNNKLSGSFRQKSRCSVPASNLGGAARWGADRDFASSQQSGRKTCTSVALRDPGLRTWPCIEIVRDTPQVAAWSTPREESMASMAAVHGAATDVADPGEQALENVCAEMSRMAHVARDAAQKVLGLRQGVNRSVQKAARHALCGHDIHRPS